MSKMGQCTRVLALASDHHLRYTQDFYCFTLQSITNFGSMAFAGAQNIDVSHSIFYDAGRDITIHNYQSAGRMCCSATDLTISS